MIESSFVKQIIMDGLVLTYFLTTGALIVIWTGATLSLFKTRTLGFVNKRETQQT